MTIRKYLPAFFFGIFFAVAATAQPLAGNYTINANQPTAGANFQSFTDFATALNDNGVAADVAVTVVAGSGPYEEQVVFDNIAGTGPGATVTLNGNGETITAVTTPTDRHVVRLVNVSYFTISNLNVNWNSQSTGGFYGIHIFGSGDHITISNCSVDLSGTTSTLYGAYVASGSLTSILTTGDFHNISIIGNTAKGGGYGASVFGLVSDLASNIVIAGNNFFDFHSNGVYLRETDGAVIRENIFNKTTPNVTSANAIQIAQNANVNARIFNNRIQIAQQSNGTLTFRGIYLFNGTGHQVYNNLIYNVNLESGNFTGIEVRTAGTAPEIYFNTISIDNPAMTSGDLAGIKEQLSNTNTVLRNNLISISQPTSGFKSALVLGPSANVNSAFDSDYNLLYVPGGNVTQRGTFSPSFYPTLAAWQNASGQDGNSLDLDPAFEAFPAVLPTNPLVDDAGLAIGEVEEDILGMPRGTPPDVGAFEFGGCAPPLTPDGIAGPPAPCANTTGIIYSIEPVPGAMVYNWSVPGDATVTEGQGSTAISVDFGSQSGTVSVTAEDSCGVSQPALLTVNLKSPPLAPTTITGNDAWCAGDTGAPFTIAEVDGATEYFWTAPEGAVITGGQGATTVTIDFPEPGAGMLSVTANNECGSSEPALLPITVHALPAVSLTLPQDTFCIDGPPVVLEGLPAGGTFSGNGVVEGQFDPLLAGYDLHLITYTYLAPESGCSNEAAITVIVLACTTDVEDVTGSSPFQIFPNPARERLQVRREGWSPTRVRLLDVTGRQLEVTTQTSDFEIDLSDHLPGIYFLELSWNGRRWVEKVVVD